MLLSLSSSLSLSLSLSLLLSFYLRASPIVSRVASLDLCCLALCVRRALLRARARNASDLQRDSNNPAE